MVILGCREKSFASRNLGLIIMNQSPEKSPTPLAPHRPLEAFYSAPSARSRFVNDLFDATAPDYDWISGVMSLWTDRWYRKQALVRSGLRPGMRLLDVASGTGLMAEAAVGLGLEPAAVAGIDPSRGMLEQNRQRNPVALLQGRGENLPFRSATFDFVCMGYALRHVDDLRKLFGEFRRVLRPGGRLLILEITRPSSAMGLRLMQFYMRKLVPLMGRLRNRSVSTEKMLEYYWATIAECVDPAVILAALEEEGFQDVRRKTVGPLLSEYVACEREVREPDHIRLSSPDSPPGRGWSFAACIDLLNLRGVASARLAGQVPPSTP